MANPIAFNPDTMTVSQLKECADALRTVFDCIARRVPAESIVHTLEQHRDLMTRKWGVE